MITEPAFFKSMVGWTSIIAGLTLALATLGSSPAYSSSESPEEKIWTLATDSIELHGDSLQSRKAVTFRLNRAFLENAFASINGNMPRAVIPLPTPEGTVTDFLLERSPVLPISLRTKYPTLDAFKGSGVDLPHYKAFVTIGDSGIHGFITSASGNFTIRRFNSREDLYLIEVQTGTVVDSDKVCLSEATTASLGSSQPKSNIQTRSSDVVRTYRLAIAATGEFTSLFNDSPAETLQAITTIMNRVADVYESELGIRLQLVPNNDVLIYTNALTDPYTENSSSLLTINQNQTNLDHTIGSQNYDLGLVFHTGNYGLAYIRSACHPNLKGRAAVGLSSRNGDMFSIDLVAHEIGHQFGANHTFNSNADVCSIHRNAATAFEPGSGSTIMAYSTLPCGSDRIQSSNDAYFHSASIEEILNYVTTGLGKYAFQVEPISNRAPIVDAGESYTIPKGTPFALTATGSDPDGDALTYCWEQLDIGPPRSISSYDTSEGPLFRSFPPDRSPTRYFPRLGAILGREESWAEQLPLTGRSMRFRATARDNGSTGRAAMDEVNITVNDAAGPFKITAPTSLVTWSGEETVTWDVAGTAAPPIGAVHVNILLSTNGGTSFDFILAEGTPNDGSEKVQLPNLHSTSCRIKIQPVSNIFFAISPNDFSLYPSSFPKLHTIVRDGTKLILNWRGVPGESYRVQASTNLASPTWEDLAGDVYSTTENFTKEHHTEGASQYRFYRVLLIPSSDSNSQR